MQLSHISVEKSIYNGFPFLESKQIIIASSQQPTRAVPRPGSRQRHVCTIFIRCRAGWCVVWPHAILYNHFTTIHHRQESHSQHGEWPKGSLAVGSQGHFQCDKSSPEQSQLFFALLIRCRQQSIGPDSFKQLHQDLGLP